ncbi:3172_t:CDS:2 [Dentiscutata erythropus]|uniref:3172_t:CDS:1 n=1 Tax=Dentiscutata erythropus TaxID=1348616 RepID=A0A9N9GES6_9GLOM|nr:3172_t:CDS:2 [Dentiscutata erythropus]
MHETVISRLNSGLKLEIAVCMYSFYRELTSFAKWSKKLAPTYDDYTKCYTFLFEDTYDINRSIYEEDIDIAVLVERSEGVSIPIRFGARFDLFNLPEFVNNNICKYEFDNRNNIYLKLEIKVGGNGQSINRVSTYSLTILAWKLYYILDCLKVDWDFNIIWDII